PNRASLVYTAEQLPTVDVCGCGPDVDGLLNPCWNRNGPHMTTFADQVDDGPVLLSLLQMLNRQVNQFRTPQTTTKQQRQHCKVSLTPDRTGGRNAEKRDR